MICLAANYTRIKISKELTEYRDAVEMEELELNSIHDRSQKGPPPYLARWLVLKRKSPGVDDVSTGSVRCLSQELSKMSIAILYCLCYIYILKEKEMWWLHVT